MMAGVVQVVTRRALAIVAGVTQRVDFLDVAVSHAHPHASIPSRRGAYCPKAVRFRAVVIGMNGHRPFGWWLSQRAQ